MGRMEWNGVEMKWDEEAHAQRGHPAIEHATRLEQLAERPPADKPAVRVRHDGERAAPPERIARRLDLGGHARARRIDTVALVARRCRRKDVKVAA
jgi:hypothetical protein